MAEVIRMPRMSDTMEEGVIVGWLKQEGDTIEPGDVLAEVETDKATMELESYQEGTLLYIGVKEGPVPVDSVVAIIGEEGEDYKPLLEKVENEGKSSENEKEEKEEEKEPTESSKAQEESTSQEKQNTTADTSGDDRLKASPLAKRIASDKGIDLQQIQGSGDGGRIIKKDVEAAAQSGQGIKSVTAPAMAIPSGEDETVTVSQMRKAIARRLGESKYSAPHFYLTAELDMDKAVEARKMINEGEEVRISFNDMVIKAVAIALRKHPYVNGSWNGDKMTLHGDVNIGVAVAVDEGLLVPVVNNADYKSLSQIKAEVKELAGKARNKKLKPDEMEGSTFTVSNLGMFGIDEFTGIINPPNSCILAVGAINKKPVVKDDQIVVGNTMKITLSCDHRIVDGAVGAQFLQTLRSYLENPMKLLL
ncbi:pyruvate dehydrogenase complex dihydrolipoamide acetyltransferase [Membranihabitans maritimus]|uniref:pyruvate dehydrogenase complex dihydrolipoamide acetyltransferase n=1 Tax=Membranihabitans maritimus TaxID=2904244 RepID=UPI001F00EED8|nr:pyruvate dehydrogenase complex dihydrolipoamide acetyltransferase [Membranihabitans maritimus]